jgi:hypothetical protein
MHRRITAPSSGGSMPAPFGKYDLAPSVSPFGEFLRP